MNSFKTVIVVSVMAVVAYGVYASLTRQPLEPTAYDESAGSDSGPAPLVHLPGVSQAVQAPSQAARGTDDHAHAGTAGRRRAKTSAGTRSPGQAPQAGSARPAAPQPPEYGTRQRLPGGGSSPGRYPDTSHAHAHSNLPPDDPGYAVAQDYPDTEAEADTDLATWEESPAHTPPGDFQKALADIRARLDEGLLTDAHRELSAWYDEADLAEEDREELLTLLDQVAGTVLYSREHLLESPYVVRAGDTLPAIAARYNVPWQLLAKINGVKDPQSLQPGQELKVLRGPFDAVVDLESFRLTLLHDGCYAGRFTIGIGRDREIPPGDYEVQLKVENPEYVGPGGETIAADDPENPLGDYLLHLGNHLSIHGTNDEESIGRAGSLGCIRLAPREIEDVFDILTVGSRVFIRR